MSTGKRAGLVVLLSFLGAGVSLRAQAPAGLEKTLQRGLACWKRGDALEAMGWFGRALGKAPRVPSIRRAFEKAAVRALEQALERGEKDRARRICRSALARLGDSPYFGTWLGRLLVEEERWDQAREILERTGRLEGGQYALLELARLLRRRGRLEEGAKVLEDALPRFSGDLRSSLSSWVRLWRVDAGIRRNKTRGRYSGGEIFLPSTLSHSTRRFLCILAGRALSEAAAATGLPSRGRVEVVFSTPEELKRAGGPSWAGGLFKDGVVRVVYSPGVRESLASTLRHEFGHALLSALAPGLPGWLQEGVAQVAEKKDPALALAFLRSLPGTLLPGSALETGFTWMQDSRLAGAAYAESYLLVLYLFQTRPGGRAALYKALAESGSRPGRALRAWMGSGLDGALLSMARRFRLKSPFRSAPPRK